MEEVEAVLKDMGFFDKAAQQLAGEKCALLIAEQKVEWLDNVVAAMAQTLIAKDKEIDQKEQVIEMLEDKVRRLRRGEKGV